MKLYFLFFFILALIQECKPVCHYSCESGTCADETAAGCETCGEGKNREFDETDKCICKVGFYDDTTNEECQPCHYSCESGTCSASEQADCLTCNEGKNREFDETDKCICKVGFYDDTTNEECQPCHYSCESGTCSASEQADCLTCNEGKNRQFDDTDKCICKDGFYDEDTKEECQPCHYSCESGTCIAGELTDCLTCDESKNREFATDKCICKDGFQDDGTNEECKLICHYSCDSGECSSGDLTGCTSCSGDKHRTLATDKCICDTGFYDDGENEQCQACHYSCSSGECSSDALTGCTACNADKHRTLDTDKCICENGFKDDGENEECELICHYSCLSGECSSGELTGCTACNADKHRTLATDKCICEDGFYDDGTTEECKPCHYTCASGTCTGPTETDCATCSDNADFHRKFDVNKCICDTATSPYQDDTKNEECVLIDASCHYTCQTKSCEGELATQCSECNPTYHRTISAENTCDCDAGFYDDGASEICKVCHYSCETGTCAGGNTATHCTDCNADKKRTYNDEQKKCLCNDKYFDDGSEEGCKDCHITCGKCSSKDVCTACNDDKHRILKADKCVCKDGFFDDGAQEECKPCHYSCLSGKCTTDAIAECTACNADKHRIFDNGKCVCAEGFYDDTSSEECQPCHYSCNGCTEGGDDKCAACSADKFREEAGGKCICLTGYFDDGSKEECRPCHFSCASAECKGGAEANCTSCNPDKYRTLDTDKCICQAGYFEDGPVEECKPCHYSCEECTAGTETACTACEDAKHREKKLNVCACKDGYYDDGSQEECQPCHYSCASGKCTGDAVDTCTGCDASKHRKLDGGKCVCMDGFYDDTTNEECVPCHFSCLTGKCTAGTADACSECNAAKHREIAGSTCNCMGGYFEVADTEECTACHYSCATGACSAGDTAADCTSCSTNEEMHRDWDATDKCKCEDTYTDDGSQEQCIKIDATCHYTCQTRTCSGGDATECTACNPTYHRQKTDDGCICMDGFFDDGNDVEICQECHYSCKTGKCEGGNTDTDCTECNAEKHRVYDDGTSKCICEDTFFDDGEFEECKPCHYSCKTGKCEAKDTCTECGADKHRTISGSDCICDDGFFDDGVSEECKPCHYSCATCFGPEKSQCGNCPTGNDEHRKVVDTTFCVCEDKFYDDGSAAICQACPPECATCFASDDCRSCVDTHYLDSKQCKSCDPRCATCVAAGPTECTSCDTGNGLEPIDDLAPKFGCKCTNSKQYVDANGDCQDCHPSCLTCKGGAETDCTSCDVAANHQDLSQTSHTCPCLPKHFADGAACSPCDDTCKSCDAGGASDCTSCMVEENWVAGLDGDGNTDGTCICKDGFFKNATTECEHCHKTCLTCTSKEETACSSCNEILHRTQGGNQCDCAENYTLNGTEVLCIPKEDVCHYSCMTGECSENFNAKACTTCVDAMDRVYDEYRKICRCKAGYFDTKYQTEKCAECDASCSSCSDEATNCLKCHSSCEACLEPEKREGCITCNSSQYRVLDDHSRCICISNYYENSDGECVRADKCGTGFVAVYAKHNKGNNGIYGNICAEKCTENTFVNSTTNVCSRYCDQSCDSCNSPENNQSCTSCSQNNQYLSDSVGECLANKSECERNSKLAYSIQDFSIKFRNESGFTINRCFSTCPTGSAKSTTANECHPCAINCKTCEAPNDFDKCVELNCTTGRYQRITGSSFVCIDDCFEEGEYLDNKTLQCRECADQQNCRTCDGPGENCTECVEGFELISGVCTPEIQCDGYKIVIDGEVNCVADCPNEGYYKNSSSRSCERCDSSCKTCSSPDDSQHCTSCHDYAYFTSSLGTCGGSCPEGTYLYRTYDNSKQYKCYGCDKGCSQCQMVFDNTTEATENIALENVETTCSACYNGYFLNGTVCQTDCVDGYYGDTSSNECKVCSSSCLTCSGGGGADCLTCKDGFVLSAAKGKSGACRAVEEMEEEYSNENIDSKLSIITTTEQISVATSEFTQTIRQSTSMSSSQKISTATKFCSKLESITETKTSFSEKESGEILTATAELASDSVITTSTVITSLVTTVTKVVEKTRIVSANGAEQVITSLNTIVTTTRSKSISSTTTTTTTQTANANSMTQQQSQQIIQNVQTTIKKVKKNVATNMQINQKISVTSTELQFTAIKLNSTSSSFLTELTASENNANNENTVAIKATQSFQQKIQSVTTRAVTISKEVWTSANPHATETKQEMASEIANIDIHDDQGNVVEIDNMKEPLELQFKKKVTTTTRSVQALYWSETHSTWKTDGVRMTSTSSFTSSSEQQQSYYYMQVYHLTEFVIGELQDEDTYCNFTIITSIVSVCIILFMALAYFAARKYGIAAKQEIQLWTISPYYSAFCSLKPSRFLEKSLQLLNYFQHAIFIMTIAIIIRTDITNTNVYAYCTITIILLWVMKYIFGSISLFLVKRHFGLHIFAAFTVLYYIGITLLSALWIDTESDNDKRLWLLGIFCIVLIDAFLDLSLIFLLHLLKIPSNSYLWKFLSLNGFTNSVRSTQNMIIAKSERIVIQHDDDQQQQHYANIKSQESQKNTPKLSNHENENTPCIEQKQEKEEEQPKLQKKESEIHIASQESQKNAPELQN